MNIVQVQRKREYQTYKKKKIILIREEQEEILKEKHDSLTADHLKRREIIQKIREVTY